ncbi:MAG: hypothetical protein WCJ33_09185, partial [Pseudomonadota bacterium]
MKDKPDNKKSSSLVIDLDKETSKETLDEFTKNLKGSLVVFNTSSPVKVSRYQEFLTTSKANIYLVSGGKVDTNLPVTDEQNSDYVGNGLEKAGQQLDELKKMPVREYICSQFIGEHEITEDKVVGMSEDSGWQLEFSNEETDKKVKFLKTAKKAIEKKLSQNHKWLANAIKPKKTNQEFPGPNLKPLQEALGGFHELMEIIYEAAEKAEIKELRYSRTAKLFFSFPQDDKIFAKSFAATGVILPKTEYEKIILNTNSIINADIVQIPTGQDKPANDVGRDLHGKSFAHLLEDGFLKKTSTELPSHHPRRDAAEWLAEILGTREGSKDKKISVAFISPDNPTGENITLEDKNIAIKTLSSNEELINYPKLEAFNNVDAIVIKAIKIKTEGIPFVDPNLSLLTDILVEAETNPASMNTDIILDNSNGEWDKTLKTFQNYFLRGRTIGDLPFKVANSQKDLEDSLAGVQRIKEFSLPLNKTSYDIEGKEAVPLPE